MENEPIEKECEIQSKPSLVLWVFARESISDVRLCHATGMVDELLEKSVGFG